MTRDEHMQWSKDRALAYLDEGDTRQAVTSMASDLRKHPDTAGIVQSFGMMFFFYADKPVGEVRQFINGFN